MVNERSGAWGTARALVPWVALGLLASCGCGRSHVGDDASSDGGPSDSGFDGGFDARPDLSVPTDSGTDFAACSPVDAMAPGTCRGALLEGTPLETQGTAPVLTLDGVRWLRDDTPRELESAYSLVELALGGESATLVAEMEDIPLETMGGRFGKVRFATYSRACDRWLVGLIDNRSLADTRIVGRVYDGGGRAIGEPVLLSADAAVVDVVEARAGPSGFELFSIRRAAVECGESELWRATIDSGGSVVATGPTSTFRRIRRWLWAGNQGYAITASEDAPCDEAGALAHAVLWTLNSEGRPSNPHPLGTLGVEGVTKWTLGIRGDGESLLVYVPPTAAGELHAQYFDASTGAARSGPFTAYVAGDGASIVLGDDGGALLQGGESLWPIAVNVHPTGQTLFARFSPEDGPLGELRMDLGPPISSLYARILPLGSDHYAWWLAAGAAHLDELVCTE